MAAAQAPAAVMTASELAAFNNIQDADEQKAYLIYRGERIHNYTRNYYWIIRRWQSEPVEVRQNYIEQAQGDSEIDTDGESDGTVIDIQYESQETAIANIIAHTVQPDGSGHWRWAKEIYDTRAVDGATDPYHRCVVSLYVFEDDGGIIKDRIVTKRVFSTDAETLMFTLNEVHVAGRLTQCDSIVRMRGAGDDRDNSTVRCYLDYYGSGDLNKLFRPYLELDGENIDENLPQFPEPFIWLVFRALAEAIYAFNTGRCASNILATGGEPLDGGKEAGFGNIIHRDIKLNNIFLGDSSPLYPAYPHPVIGDFGAALDLTDAELLSDIHQGLPDPLIYGTLGWYPPELHFRIPGTSYSSKADIWDAGLVIWNMMYAKLGLMKLRDFQLDAPKYFDFESAEPFPMDQHADMSIVYSSNLKNLVRKCLKIDPDERPSFVRLRNSVESEMLAIESRLVNASAESIESIPDQFRLNPALPDDPFAIIPSNTSSVRSKTAQEDIDDTRSENGDDDNGENGDDDNGEYDDDSSQDGDDYDEGSE
ncbi:kinase-like domain-containing protein [Dendryphion nanum]|uniref:non-specific serine/threonine protein kinase n=1 Tax=Dendryphion nanum TaxID=256645 RepID=A0A9P9I7Y2_9PLEO|nr:kinase-like domain-containing protein [Dendryphion nanum]